MEKEEIILKLKKEKIVAIVRAESESKIEKIVESIVSGGINFIEITMTIPKAVEVIKQLCEKYKSNTDVVIGAGTVLDSETARMAILAGAKYIVSPSLNTDTVKLCNRYRVPIIPGIMTVREAIEALELGVDILKIFPQNIFEPSIIKAFKGPLPQANFIPTGGISLESAHEWIKNGAVAIGTGNNLIEGAKRGDYETITNTARDFITAVKEVTI